MNRPVVVSVRCARPYIAMPSSTPFTIPRAVAALALIAAAAVGCASSQSKGPESEPPNTTAPTATAADLTESPAPTGAATPSSANTAQDTASTRSSEPVEPGEVAVPGASASAWHTSQSDGKPDKGDRGIRDYQRIVQENRDKFRACYDAARGQGSNSPNIRGKVTLVWTLDPQGNLREGASIDRTASDFYDEFLEKCMVGALKQLTFPPSRRGLDSTVRYPFDFKPQGRSPR